MTGCVDPRRAAGARARGGVCSLISLAVAAGLPAAGSAQQGELSVRAGIEHASGDYGGPRDVDDVYVPFSLLYDRGRLAFRVTVPYLEVEFANAASADGLPTFTESGLGDTVLGLTVYDVLRSNDGSALMDLTGEIELPTADEDRGLGTGETDYSLQADFYKFLGRGTLVGTVGYKVRGEPAAFALDDSWRLSAGGLYRFSAATSGGLFYDYRESAIPGAPAIRELTALLGWNLREPWRAQGYVVRGLSDTSVDWAAGFSVRRDF